MNNGYPLQVTAVEFSSTMRETTQPRAVSRPLDESSRPTGVYDSPGSTAVWLTADEAAQYLKVKTRTLLLWVRQGKIKGHTLSGIVRHRYRFRQADLDATLESPSVRPEEGWFR
jgi:excisionase family DNA binding protein